MRKLPKKAYVEPESMRRLTNVYIPDMEFGDWTTVRKGYKKDYWLCLCVCGVEREVHVYSLKSGKSTSCGCARLKKKAKAKESSSE